MQTCLMKQEIHKDNESLIIKLSVPLKTRRYNPYEEKENDYMDNIVGNLCFECEKINKVVD